MQANTSAPNMPDSAWMLCSMWIKGVCIGLTHHDSHLNCSKVSKYQALCALLEINLQYSGSQLENRLFWKSPLLSLLVHLSVSTQRHRRHFCWDISQIPALIITKYSRLSSIINLYSKVVVVSSIQYNLMISCRPSLPRHLTSVFPPHGNAIHRNARQHLPMLCTLYFDSTDAFSPRHLKFL